MLKIWDFSGYNTITTEEIKSPMQYYWDSSHHTEEVTSIIFSKILDIPSTYSLPSDFGVKINNSNIDFHLANIRYSKELYEINNKLVIDDLVEQYTAVKQGEPRDDEKVKGIFGD